MITELSFYIECKGLDELIRENKMYPKLRSIIRSKSTSRSVYTERIEKLTIAELNTKTAILYQLYKDDVLSSEFFDCMISQSGQAFFGDATTLLLFQSRVCRVLADLDVPKIGASCRLSDLYHELRVIVDESKKSGVSFLHREQFWRLYFIFYEEYNK